MTKTPLELAADAVAADVFNPVAWGPNPPADIEARAAALRNAAEAEAEAAHVAAVYNTAEALAAIEESAELGVDLRNPFAPGWHVWDFGPAARDVYPMRGAS